MAQLSRLTAEQFLFLEEAFAASWALAAAGEQGVLERLDAGPVEPGTLDSNQYDPSHLAGASAQMCAEFVLLSTTAHQS